MPPSQPLEPYPTRTKRHAQPGVKARVEGHRREFTPLEEGDRYIAVIADRNGVIPNGTLIPVPNHKMKWDAGNPTGHGVIFLRPEMVRLNEWTVYCYVAPGGV